MVSIAIRLVLINGPNKTVDDHEHMQWFILGKSIHTIRFFTHCSLTAEEDERRNEKQKREASSFFISVGKTGLPPA
jgi:hypothetical protein